MGSGRLDAFAGVRAAAGGQAVSCPRRRHRRARRSQGGGERVRGRDSLRQFRRWWAGKVIGEFIWPAPKIFSPPSRRALSSTRAARRFTPRPAANGSTKKARRNRRTKPEGSCAKPKNSLGKGRTGRPARGNLWPGPLRAAAQIPLRRGAPRSRRRAFSQPGAPRRYRRGALSSRHILPNEGRTTAGIVNVADNEPMTQRACYAWLAARLHRPLPALADPPAGRKRGASNKQVSNQRLRALGWQPRFPTFPTGMENSVLPASSTLGA